MIKYWLAYIEIVEWRKKDTPEAISKGCVCSVEATLVIEGSSVMLLLNWEMSWFVALFSFWRHACFDFVMVCGFWYLDYMGLLFLVLKNWAFLSLCLLWLRVYILMSCEWKCLMYWIGYVILGNKAVCLDFFFKAQNGCCSCNFFVLLIYWLSLNCRWGER